MSRAVEESNRRMLRAEVDADVDMGFMRWLTVRIPGRPDRQVLLERPGPPAMSEETAAQVRELVTNEPPVAR